MLSTTVSDRGFLLGLSNCIFRTHPRNRVVSAVEFLRRVPTLDILFNERSECLFPFLATTSTSPEFGGEDDAPRDSTIIENSVVRCSLHVTARMSVSLRSYTRTG